MSANKYPGYCVTCSRQVGANHGELERSATGAYVVRCTRSARSEAPRASEPKAPRKAGSCVAGEGIYELLRRDSGSDASALVGEVRRAGAKVREIPGQIYTVVGAECHYENAEWNEDCGDMQGAGWRARLWVRLATAEEAAPILAAEKAKADKLAAEKAAHENAAAVYAAARTAALAGLVQTTVGPESWNRATATQIASGAGPSAPVLSRVVDAAGNAWILEDLSRPDWDYLVWHGAPAAVASVRLGWATRNGITRAAAASYSYSYAAEDYRALLDILTPEIDASIAAATQRKAVEEAARLDAADERRYEDRWSEAQGAAVAERTRAQATAARARAYALAQLTEVQRAALAQIEAAGESGAVVVSRASENPNADAIQNARREERLADDERRSNPDEVRS